MNKFIRVKTKGDGEVSLNRDAIACVSLSRDPDQNGLLLLNGVRLKLDHDEAQRLATLFESDAPATPE